MVRVRVRPALISMTARGPGVDGLEMLDAAGNLLRSSAPSSPQRSRSFSIVIVFILVFLVAGVGAAYSAGLFSSAGLTHKQTSSSAIAATATMNSSSSASGMPPGCVLAKTESSQGYSIEVFLSNSTRIGENVCIGLIVQNVSGGAPGAQGIIQQINITDSSGKIVSVWAPAITTTGTLQPGHYIAGSGLWDSSTAYDGITPQAGTYHVNVDVKIPQNGPNAAIELTTGADFSLTK